MIRSLLSKFFGCTHSRTTFPLTPSRKSMITRNTYVACLGCGKEFDYDWNEMRIGRAVSNLAGSRAPLVGNEAVSRLAGEPQCSTFGQPADLAKENQFRHSLWKPRGTPKTAH